MSPALQEQLRQHRALAEERILAALVHHGALSFNALRRKALPNLGFREVDNATKRLARLAQAESKAVERDGPRLWHITDAGRARLNLPLSPHSPDPSPAA